MAKDISLKTMEDWLRYTESSKVKTKDLASAQLKQLDGTTPDKEYQAFARLLVRSVINNAILAMGEPNAPSSVKKLAFSVDVEIQLPKKDNRAAVTLSCCSGAGCSDYLANLNIA